MGLNESQAQIQEEKIGYVNPQAILQKMPEMKAVQQRLQNFIEKKRNEVAQQNQNLQEEINAYQQKQSVISQQAKEKEEERLGQLQADLQQSQREAQQAIQEKQQELVGPLLQEINKGIDAVAQEMGLSYVLNTTTNSGDLIILYASDEAQQKYDITDEVMAELGIGE
ncbi:MAG: OmpH family outer membrane protein [Balneolaceae bacterium]|nr:OmpH family outer membrane protein [Balneolaceae bacterium]